MTRKREPKWLRAARVQGRDFQPDAKPEWLARALARAGVLPRESAEQAIRAGRVAINGKVVREPLVTVRKGDEVRVDGRPVSLETVTRVLLFHKPSGVVTAPVDPENRGTVFELLQAQLPPELKGYYWHAVGRLDRNTTGLLLFTNDERLVEHVTSPKTHLAKRYVAQVQGTADEQKVEPLRHGVTIDDGKTRPAKVVLRGPQEVELTISEGRYHQVKRMLAAVKLPVVKLHREAVGALVLDVPEGGWRELSPDEIRQKLGFGG